MFKAEKRWCEFRLFRRRGLVVVDTDLILTLLFLRSLGVTGTPIQNSLQDVYALLKFLRHEPWCEAGFWKAAITNAATETGGDDATKSDNARGKTESTENQETARRAIALSRVKRLLAPLILRRTKDTVNENGYAKMKTGWQLEFENDTSSHM
jgi:hypothetical protein